MKENHSILPARAARLALLYAAFFVFCSAAFCEERNALLIANGSYPFGNLANPVREARDLKKSLEKLGFNVALVENADIDAMEAAIYKFGGLLKSKAGIGFFHYGGHTVQVGGKNYLIPANTDIESEGQIKRLSLDLDDLMESMQGEANIVILDACRNNPFPAATRGAATRGLVLSQVKPKNSIIVYSAEAGHTAQDGVFTPILTKKLLEPKSLHSILTEARREVYKKTNGSQLPKNDDGLLDDIYLAGHSSASDSSASISASYVAPNSPPSPIYEEPKKESENSEYAMWAAVDTGNDLGAKINKVVTLAEFKSNIHAYRIRIFGSSQNQQTLLVVSDLYPAYNLGDRVLGIKKTKNGLCIVRNAKSKVISEGLVEAAEKAGWKKSKASGGGYTAELELLFKDESALKTYLDNYESSSDDLAAIFKAAK